MNVYLLERCVLPGLTWAEAVWLAEENLEDAYQAALTFLGAERADMRRWRRATVAWRYARCEFTDGRTGTRYRITSADAELPA